jgi:hypothetical protein
MYWSRWIPDRGFALSGMTVLAKSPEVETDPFL